MLYIVAYIPYMDPMGYKSYFTWLSRYPYLQKCLSCGKWTSEAHEPSIFDAVRPTVSHLTSLLVQPIALEDKFFWPVEPSPSSTANGKETPGIAQILVDYHRPSKKGHKRGVSPIFRQTHMLFFFFDTNTISCCADDLLSHFSCDQSSWNRLSMVI